MLCGDRTGVASGCSLPPSQGWRRASGDAAQADTHSAGADAAILAQRHALYEQAKAEHPERWSGATRDWRRPGAVTLNPAGANATPPAPAE
jgi:hypothetical protein